MDINYKRGLSSLLVLGLMGSSVYCSKSVEPKLIFQPTTINSIEDYCVNHPNLERFSYIVNHSGVSIFKENRADDTLTAKIDSPGFFEKYTSKILGIFQNYNQHPEIQEISTLKQNSFNDYSHFFLKRLNSSYKPRKHRKHKKRHLSDPFSFVPLNYNKKPTIFKRKSHSVKISHHKLEKPVQTSLRKRCAKKVQDNLTVTVVHVKSDKTIEYDRYKVPKDKIDGYDSRK